MTKGFARLVPYEIHYQDTGPKDDHALLLFNGIGASIDTLSPLIEQFPDRRVVTFDIPGVGQSPTPNFPYHYSTMAKLAFDLLNHLEIETADVFGVSWGGGLAQQFAFDFPNKTQTLTLAATAAGYIHYPGRPTAMMHMLDGQRHEDPEYLKAIAAELYGGQIKKDPSIIDEHVGKLGTVSKLGYMYQLAAISTWTSWNFLPQLTMPTLILVGEDDPILPSYNGRMLESRIPNAKRIVMECGHLFIVTQPKETADLMKDFISEHEMYQDAPEMR